VALLDGEVLVAEAQALPVAWDGTTADLPAGWDEGFVRGMTSESEPTCLQALAISVLPSRQGERTSRRAEEGRYPGSVKLTRAPPPG